MQPQFSSQSQQVVARAKQLAEEQGSSVAGEALLFLSVLEVADETDPMIAPLLALSGVSREEARFYAQSAIEIVPPIVGKTTQLSRSARKVLYNAAIRARIDSTRRIEPHDILIACVDYRGSHSVLGELLYWGKSAPLGEMLRSLGFETAQLRQHLRELKKRQSAPDRFTHRAELALEAAHAAMRAGFCGRISAAHLLLGLLVSGENIATETLEKAGCDLEELQQRARASIRSDGEIATHEKRYSPGAKRALERAARAAKAAGHRHIDCGYLLLGLLPARQTLGEKWRARGRELDGVDGLWTAEQVAALSGALRDTHFKVTPAKYTNAVHRSFRLTNSDSGLKMGRGSGITSFVGALIWSAGLPVLPPISRRTTFDVAFIVGGVVVLVVSGIGACTTMILGSSPHRKHKWMGAFIGWLLGMLLGFFLFDVINSNL